VNTGINLISLFNFKPTLIRDAFLPLVSSIGPLGIAEISEEARAREGEVDGLDGGQGGLGGRGARGDGGRKGRDRGGLLGWLPTAAPPPRPLVQVPPLWHWAPLKLELWAEWGSGLIIPPPQTCTYPLRSLNR